MRLLLAVDRLLEGLTLEDVDISEDEINEL